MIAAHDNHHKDTGSYIRHSLRLGRITMYRSMIDPRGIWNGVRLAH
jgi:hypothetical protein